jgi:hypothetical protein
MVIVILTRDGFVDAQEKLATIGCSIWVNGGILSEDEAKQLWQMGADMTRFSAPNDPDDAGHVASMIDTIRMHHPDECIFLETGSPATQS